MTINYSTCFKLHEICGLRLSLGFGITFVLGTTHFIAIYKVPSIKPVLN